MPWPGSTSFGCTRGGDWKILDSSMSVHDKSKCQLLCINEGENGCCFLKTGVGCYWRSGSHSSSTIREIDGLKEGISVTCSSEGRQRYYNIIINIIIIKFTFADAYL